LSKLNKIVQSKFLFVCLIIGGAGRQFLCK
jgi:hypothetical protein